MLARQYKDFDDSLSEALINELLFHMLLPQVVGSRVVPPFCTWRPTTVNYSHATFKPVEANPAKLGPVVFHEKLLNPLGLAEKLKPRNNKYTMLSVSRFVLSKQPSKLGSWSSVIWFTDDRLQSTAL